ncbi:MAG TPA: GNAT family N-acetyltransferase [Symbiobacteriaceae bacterium]
MGVRHLDGASDIQAILSFLPELYETNFPGFSVDAEFLARKRAQLKEAARDPGQCVLVYEDELGVGGFIWLVVEVEPGGRRRGEVVALHVAPRCRGKGIGKLLMKEGEALLRNYGCESVHLMVTVSNERALKLYENLGYVVTRYQMEKPIAKHRM